MVALCCVGAESGNERTKEDVKKEDVCAISLIRPLVISRFREDVRKHFCVGLQEVSWKPVR